jgi:vanillate O-demethylase monooxygenase subunit
MKQSEAAMGVSSKGKGVADRNTPLLRNYWYVAAFSEEITRTPMRRTILNQDIVFYRTEDGKPVAVQNRCPHRSFPLHMGYLKGDRIVCNYHGIEFNPDGSCGHVPALNSAPGALRLDHYPLEEDGPLLWIWMGDPANPDYSRLIRQEWCTSPKWAHVKDYMYMKANYLGLHENLLDLTHFAFLHSKWNFFKMKHLLDRATVKEEGDTLIQREEHEDVDMDPNRAAKLGMTGPFTQRIKSIVKIPGIHQGRSITSDSSSPPIDDVQHIIHIMTPETATSTHYFWAIAYDAFLDSPEFAAGLHALGAAAFDEDKVALEDIEEIYVRDHRPGYREKIIKSDEGSIRVLRLMNRLAEKEQRELEQPATAA